MDVKETTAKKTAKLEKVEISKEQFENLMNGYEDMKNQLAVLTKQAAENDNLNKSTDFTRQEEERLLEIIRAENAKGEELVNLHIERGSLKSNQNSEVSINGSQAIVPKGEDVMVKRKLKEVVDNSEKQKAAALALQDKLSEEYQKAEDKGML